MMLLPQKVGPFTLMRRLGGDGVAESYLAILGAPAGKQVLARRIHPWFQDSAQRQADLDQRIQELMAARHSSLIRTLGYQNIGNDHYLLGGNREGQQQFGSGAGKVSWQYLPGVVSSTSVKYMATQSISDIPLGG